MNRSCSGCTLCCKLVPQVELQKGAGERCKHQRHTGCRIYQKRPYSCRLWSCEWLRSTPGTEKLSRPDRSHYIIDPMPDFVTAITPEGEELKYAALQIWMDPAHRDAHLDPALREYIDRRGREDQMIALIRYSNSDGWVLAPPSMTGGGWAENHDGINTEEHSAEEKFATVGDLMERALK